MRRMIGGEAWSKSATVPENVVLGGWIGGHELRCLHSALPGGARPRASKIVWTSDWMKHWQKHFQRMIPLPCAASSPARQSGQVSEDCFFRNLANLR